MDAADASLLDSATASSSKIIAGSDRVAILMALIAALASPDEDSNRVRVRIAQAVVARRWPLGDAAETLAANPPPGYVVAGDRLQAI